MPSDSSRLTDHPKRWTRSRSLPKTKRTGKRLTSQRKRASWPWNWLEWRVSARRHFTLTPLVQASTLDYLCSFDGGMEDCCASMEMLEHSLKIYEKHLGEDHWQLAWTLVNLSNANGRLGDPRKQKKPPRACSQDTGKTLRGRSTIRSR